MKKLIILLALLTLLIFNLHTGVSAELPNSKLTPGYMRDVSVKELCTTSTSAVRNVPELLKKQVFAEYKLLGNDRSVCKEGYEVDHLVSLELGGANDKRNLWPQSYCGTNNAHDKDKLENELHRRICKGQINIIDAQMCIKTDWVMCYLKIFNK
jgi:hypothetical protein